MVLEFRVHMARAPGIGGEGPEGGLRGRLQSGTSVTVAGREFEVFSFKFSSTRRAGELPVARFQIPDFRTGNWELGTGNLFHSLLTSTATPSVRSGNWGLGTYKKTPGRGDSRALVWGTALRWTAAWLAAA